MEIYINIAYLFAAVCFIYGLKMLSHPKTARNGNLISSFGMLVAIIATVSMDFQTSCNSTIPGSCSDKAITVEADCTGDDKEWTADVTEAVEAADEAACIAAEGTWTGEKAKDPAPTDPPATDPPAGN